MQPSTSLLCGLCAAVPVLLLAADEEQVKPPDRVSPKLSASISAEWNAWSGMELRFEVRADHALGAPLTLTLLDPPPALSFQPALNETPPLRREVRWFIPGQAGGLWRLRFRATTAAGVSSDLTVPVQVGGDLSPTNITSGDVTGDGILDVVAATPWADVNGVKDVGAIYVWAGGAGGAPSATLLVPGARSGDRLADNNAQALQLVDMTGDGVLDVVAAASNADAGEVPDAGAVFVWKGGDALRGTVSPHATLRLPDPSAGDQLSHRSPMFSNFGQGLLFGDLNADARLDLIASADLANFAGVANAGVIAVWYGGAGLAGAPPPGAILRVPGASAGDRLGHFGGQGVQLADVTGDGRMDLVAGATLAGLDDTGAVYVWAGGPTLLGTRDPDATLTVPGALPQDRLGYHEYNSFFGKRPANQLLRLADVTGDEIADVVAGAPRADVAAAADAGAVYVWKGGPSLSGAVAPHATLVAPAPVAGDQLAHVGAGQGIRLVDLVGSSTLDLVVGAGWADIGGVSDVGARFVWRGGATLAGTPAPEAVLSDPGALAGDQLGYDDYDVASFADVTGDGRLDLVVAAPFASPGLALFGGAVYVWSGGSSLAGNPPPTARLFEPSSQNFLGSLVHGRGLLLADVTGDGVHDVLAGTNRAWPSSQDTVFVWSGGAALTGDPAALAILTGERLGIGSGQTLQAADLTGDGVLDVLATATWAAHKGVLTAGELYLWAGGSSLNGKPAPTALGRAQPGFGDELGQTYRGHMQGVQLVDFTGDGVLDIVAQSDLINHGGKQNAGGIVLWRGGPNLANAPAPDGELFADNAAPRDFMGKLYAFPSGFKDGGQGVQIIDLDGDGLVEILAGATDADVAGVADVGAAYLWRPGGLVPAGSDPQEMFSVPGAAAMDFLGGG